jgi:ABC-type lipoprotein release transport system permease subunit
VLYLKRLFDGYKAGAASFVTASILAATIPVLRIARIDPATTLRDE